MNKMSKKKQDQNYQYIKVDTKKIFRNEVNNADFNKLLKSFNESDKSLIIVGPRGSGKSRLARNLAYRSNMGCVVDVDGRNYSVSERFVFHSCTEDTKLLVADGFTNSNNLKDFLFFTMDSIFADRLYYGSIVINPKKIIVCEGNIKLSDLPKGISMYRRFNVINLFTDASCKNEIETFSLYRLQWELQEMKPGDWFYIEGDDDKWELYDESSSYFFIRSTHTKQLIAIQKQTNQTNG